MSFTYNIATDRGKVRFRCGDKESQDYVLEDDEIDYLLTVSDSIDATAIEACERMISKIFKDIDRSGVGVNNTRSQKITHITQTMDTLRANYNRTAGADFAEWGTDETFFTGLPDS